ncbi:MAG TPA: hypothetical protein VHV09_05700 [Trebonia sp.]|jgi:hypothetical protein|nr:hypothetical protein [Trebonia sp.]
MSAVVPVQYLADMVVLISDAATLKPVLAVIIEPQLRDSETKRYSWPVHVTTARRVARCPAAEVNDADRVRMTARAITVGTAAEVFAD